jgi:hypothetical protein
MQVGGSAGASAFVANFNRKGAENAKRTQRKGSILCVLFASSAPLR